MREGGAVLLCAVPFPLWRRWGGSRGRFQRLDHAAPAPTGMHATVPNEAAEGVDNGGWSGSAWHGELQRPASSMRVHALLFEPFEIFGS
jgi:hypothetical protein